MLKLLKSNLSISCEIDNLKGKWYEIARNSNRFESGMSDVRVYFDILDDYSADFVFAGVKGNRNIICHNKLHFCKSRNSFKIKNLCLRIKTFRILSFDVNSKTIIISDRRCRRLWIFTQKMPVTQDFVNHILINVNHLGFEINKLITTHLDYQLE